MDITSTPPAESHIDGRTLRAQKTRNNILRAARELLYDPTSGNIPDRMPTVSEVAKAANVSVRTVFEHFHDVLQLGSAIFGDAQLATDVGEAMLRSIGFDQTGFVVTAKRDDKGELMDPLARQIDMALALLAYRLAVTWFARVQQFQNPKSQS